ncbi:MAG: DUF3604 domain-containing protein, partial [Planctomycetota bacterium]
MPSFRTKAAPLCLLIVSASALAFVMHAFDRPKRVMAQSDSRTADAPLRQRIEKLKADVAATPTDLSNIIARTRTLWDWANHLALQGKDLHPEVASITALILTREDNLTDIPRSYTGHIDNYVQGLTRLEEKPDSIGVLTANTDTPLVANSYATLTQTYTVGSEPMRPGGGVIIAKHFMANHGTLQTQDPGADNYLTVRTDQPNASFVEDSVQMTGMHGGFRTSRANPFFKLQGAPLPPGARITVTYGDTSRGSRGFKVQTYANDRFPLPLYIDLTGQGERINLPIQAFRVVGAATTGVHGFAPSVVATGEPFSISVRSEDIWYNRASDAIPGYHVLLNGQPFTQKANPVWVKDAPEQRVYWGETHGHSGFAEGQGTAAGYFKFGYEDARLDFLTHSEHDLWMDDAEWNTLIRSVEQYHREGEFIAYLGHEWTAYIERGGHHNVLFRTPRKPDGSPRIRQGQHTTPMLSDLYRNLQNHNDDRDVLVIPHAHMMGDYRYSHPDVEPLVEIMSMHGTFEWFGRKYIEHGHEVGFIAASDDHLSHPGYASPLTSGLSQRGGLAAVIAPQKSTDTIFDAMRAKRTYATTGQRMILDFNLNDAPMGARTEAAYRRNRQIQGRVIGTAPIEHVAIVKNGQEVWRRDLTTEQPTGSHMMIRFASESEPLAYDNPRGWRVWQGELTVRNAAVQNAVMTTFQNRQVESLETDSANPNRIRFRTRTRGNTSAILLELD